MSDDDIPGLTDYLECPTVTDSPVNRQAYRFVWSTMRQYSAESGNEAGMKVVFSETLARYIAMGGVIFNGIFIPMMFVAQSEILDAAGLDIRPAPGEPSTVSDHYGDPLKPQPTQDKLSDTAFLNEAFMHSVESLRGDEDLDPKKYEGFYLAPRQKGNGGEEDTGKGHPGSPT